MIWRNPWAWLGLFSLAVPIAIHLLTRRPPRRQKFPSLRFLSPTRLTPSRRTVLSDIPLLLLRLAILLLATAALAQPFVVGRTRRIVLERATPTRVILIDTSASMQRSTRNGARAIDEARTLATRAAEETAIATVLETARPAAQLAGAAEWLATQRGPHEIIIISDFQRGSLDSTDLAHVPTTTGIALVALPIQADTALLSTSHRSANHETTTTQVTDSAGTHAEWQVQEIARIPAGVRVLAGAATQDYADAALDAVLGTMLRGDNRVTFVFPDHANRDALLRASRPLTQPWMGDVAARVIQDDPNTKAASSDAGELLLFLDAPANSAAAVDLMYNGLSVLQNRAHVLELEPEAIPDVQIAQWQRAPGRSGGDGDEGSDGRWLWLAALVLLGAESRVRRQHGQRTVIVTQEALERVA